MFAYLTSVPFAIFCLVCIFCSSYDSFSFVFVLCMCTFPLRSYSHHSLFYVGCSYHLSCLCMMFAMFALFGNVMNSRCLFVSVSFDFIIYPFVSFALFCFAYLVYRASKQTNLQQEHCVLFVLL